MSTVTLKGDLRDYLVADATLSGLVGTRVYPTNAQEAPDTPYVVYSMVGEGPQYTHGQAEDGETTQREVVWQFDSFGLTALQAEQVNDAVRGRLEGTKFSQGSTEFGGAFVDTDFDNFDEVARSDGRSGYFRKTMQVRTILNV